MIRLTIMVYAFFALMLPRSRRETRIFEGSGRPARHRTFRAYVSATAPAHRLARSCGRVVGAGRTAIRIDRTSVST